MLKHTSRCLAAFLVLVAQASALYAGDWDIGLKVGVSEAFTDNAGLRSDAEKRETEFVTTLTPGVSIRGAGRRVSLNLDYSLNRVIYAKGTDSDRFQNDLAAAGNAELLKDLLFLDTRASISRQVTDPRGPDTETETGQLGNASTVMAYSVAPTVRHRLGSWVDVELGAGYDQVNTRASAVGDTTTLREALSFTSGKEFTRLRWELDLSHSWSERDHAAVQRRALVNSKYTLDINEKVALVSSLGYEKIDDDTLDAAPDGLIWDAGIDLHPGPKSSLRATYGHRFDTETYSFAGSYQFSPRTTLTASYDDSIRTSQQQIIDDLQFIGVGPGGELIDTRTGQPFEPGNDGFGLQSTTFRTKRFSANLNGTRQRNTFGVTANWESRQTDGVNAAGDADADQIVIGAALNFDRQLTRRTNAGIALNYRNTDFGGGSGREDNLFSVSGRLAMRVFKDATANLTYTYTKRNSNESAFKYHENAVVLNLTKTF